MIVHFKRVGQLQVSEMDATLRQYLNRSVEDLPEYPDIFLTNVRGIVNRAFELIWNSELDGRRIPSEWIATWKYNQERVCPISAMTSCASAGNCCSAKLLTRKFGTRVELGKRVIASERFDLLSHQQGSAWQAWRRDRLLAEGDVPWLTVAAARVKLAELKEDCLPAQRKQLSEIERFLENMIVN